ncbi:auxilin-like protein SWA2 KNAG_0C05500 [Huiozyma naganishii CBS 8797]|uniref:SWA2-like ubiquitin-associated domain-containing protein n=1 Tax=Huiozyma naganishii (strain ATCC MYA-139 / BCRC 22969 / CBS 8797 / KCTC 17520 / NBRC 10181 / NCYC 3082 / Yp74L-3) TaxID=1071383 RepID=J7RJF1_HUIN7|nr:hypothetical protein KNAG_0C05500 [Kazachstania naganishii CBS 8797]CCK69648.1 hypothetical protein KNAG_0C05500 [Kazachstania naganishii CBS 8797]
MADPFASLLTSFKESSKKPAAKSESPEPVTVKGGGEPATASTHAVFMEPLIPSGGGQGSFQQKPAGSDDKFDDVFDLFNSEPAAEVKEPDRVPSDESVHENVAVVDEVRDMEVAKIMSLGFGIDKAVEFYDSGVLYDELVERRDRRHIRHTHTRHSVREVTEVPKHTGNSFFSAAVGLLNKGKDFVDHLTAYPDEEGDRLARYRQEHADAAHFGDFTPGEREQDLLIDDFESKVSITDKHNPPLAQTPDETLLDFGEDDSSKSGSRTHVNNSPSIELPIVPISTMELSGYNEFRAKGTELFKKGDYSAAVLEYEKSLNTLPEKHPLRIIAMSNMMLPYLKIGEYTKCLKLAPLALELIPEDRSTWRSVIQQSEPKRTYRDIWSKLVMRLAEAQEHAENYTGAFDNYQLLVANGITNEKVMDGKRRCQKVLNPPSKVERKGTPTPTPQVVTPARTPDPATSKTVYENAERVKRANAKSEQEEAAKMEFYDVVETKVNNWKGDKEGDIRYLLSHLTEIVTWVEWNSVSQADLVMPKRVKITYLKAIAKIHPDKIPADLPLEYRMIADTVFSVLNNAWEKFKLDNNIN